MRAEKRPRDPAELIEEEATCVGPSGQTAVDDHKHSVMEARKRRKISRTVSDVLRITNSAFASKKPTCIPSYRAGKSPAPTGFTLEKMKRENDKAHCSAGKCKAVARAPKVVEILSQETDPDCSDIEVVREEKARLSGVEVIVPENSEIELISI